MKTVGVVVGIIFNGNKFLVERRRSNEKIDPGIVCLPAGHIKPNENKEDALKREMKEELDIDIKEIKFVCKNFYVASNGERQHAFCYLVTEYEGNPICKDAEDIFWEKNIDKLDLEVDKKTILKIRELLKV
ncbi:MAG: NUDIX domain-containing protein [Candidatus Bathyarchaeota archaeon]